MGFAEFASAFNVLFCLQMIFPDRLLEFRCQAKPELQGESCRTAPPR
jgi:hypothetical protein